MELVKLDLIKQLHLAMEKALKENRLDDLAQLSITYQRVASV